MAMYLITNRLLNSKQKDLKLFGSIPNAKGSHEINIVNVSEKNNKWVAKPINDVLTVERVKELKKKYKLDISVNDTWHGSLEVACELFENAIDSGKSILFFVHGYNNDVEDVLKSAEAIAALYNVIVVPFSWPANGGELINGAASYLSDKADARQSTNALNRIVGKIGYYHQLLTKGHSDKLRKKVAEKHPENRVAARQLFTKLQGKACQTKISLLCHSMGNYVLKHTLMTSDSITKSLVFDNICLIAADTNNKDHKHWVGKLDVRNRCYIVINENDGALAASRVKPGDEQLARLGHYLRKLDATNAYYIDVTKTKGVFTEHTYFKDDAVDECNELRWVFNEMFNGRSIEQRLNYQVDTNTYIMNDSVLVDDDFDCDFD